MAKQLEFKGTSGWGGKRKNAGRPNLSNKRSHVPRPRVDFKKPLHITQKLNAGYPSLRRRQFLHLFHRSAKRAQKFGLHIIHFSLLRNHLHITVEARDNNSLASGMKSLTISFALALKRKSGLEGSVYEDRYHLTVITSPTQMKNSLRYVLLNYAKHANVVDHLDEYSSAWYFDDWEYLVKDMSMRMILELESKREELPDVGLMKPQSWLASRGWKRAV